jgi:hypothetical protein
MEKKIELTELELKMLKMNVDRTYFAPDRTDEEIEAMHSVIDKADNLMEELEVYEESGSDLMKWFLKKYQEQNKGNL